MDGDLIFMPVNRFNGRLVCEKEDECCNQVHRLKFLMAINLFNTS